MDATVPEVDAAVRVKASRQNAPKKTWCQLVARTAHYASILDHSTPFTPLNWMNLDM
jgi:hypothetical protein